MIAARVRLLGLVALAGCRDHALTLATASAPAADASMEPAADASMEPAAGASAEVLADAGAETAADARIDAGGGASAGDAPRLVAPLATSRVTSQTPVLRWSSASGDPVAIAICRDRACARPVVSFTAGGTSASPPAPLAPGLYFWHVDSLASGRASRTWHFSVGARSSSVNTSWGTVVDVNGDGLADVVTGAPSVHTNGSAEVFMAGAGDAGVSATPIELASPGASNALFGGHVASAGDVNGDGYGDVVVGAGGSVGYGGTPPSIALFLGGPDGIATQPVVIALPAGATANFGQAVSSAGDVNGDGYADVIVGAGNFSGTGDGSAYVYLGGPAGLGAAPLVLTDPMHAYGQVVAPAGDVNGDGFGDVLVGANPQVYLYLGGAGGIATMPQILPSAHGVEPVAPAGDVNGDGYADVVVGGPDDEPGAVDVYLGSAHGVVTPSIRLPPPDGVLGRFGRAVSGAGDVNGDGFDDLAVGAECGLHDEGCVAIYLGGASGPVTPPAILRGTTNQDFGWSVAGAGDVDGDGYADLVVGGLRSGTFVFQGGAAGLATTWSMHVLIGGTTVARRPFTPPARRRQRGLVRQSPQK